MSEAGAEAGTEAGTGGRHRRGGGGAARRAERTAHRVEAAPFIRRRIPNYEILDEEGLALIEANAETVLEETGVRFADNPAALELWRGAGAEVRGDRVHLPKGLARSLCATAPREYVQHARNPERNVTIGGKNLVLAPVYGPPFVRDMERGRRYATIEDFRNFVKLAYVSPWLHHSGGTVCEPTDIAVNKRHLDMMLAHMTLSRQAVHGQRDRGVAGGRFGGDVPDPVRGGERRAELLHDEPDQHQLAAHVRFGDDGVARGLCAGGAGGAGVAVHRRRGDGAGERGGDADAAPGRGDGGDRLCAAGEPRVPGDLRGVRDLDRHELGGADLRDAGGVEDPLGGGAAGAAAEPAVPLGRARSARSKLPDAQAAYESANTLQAALVGGVNFMLHACGWLEGGLVSGYEKFVLDADQLGVLHSLAEGIDLSENGQAMDAIREVGPGGHFLGCAHTQANFKDAFWRTQVLDYRPFETWAEAGEPDSMRLANARVRRMLGEYEAPALDAGIAEALREFVARRKASEPDAFG